MASVEISPYSILPFINFILLIAFIPFVFPRFWEKYHYILCLFFASITIGYYVLINMTDDILHSFSEYIMFISLLVSLYVITGGILIDIKGRSTPFRNVLLLFAGAILSNVIGTIGATMLLIRPYIRTNKIRISKYHIVFFIFIVSNMGGLLTPVGNPPLFIGYLKGVPFLWNVSNLFLPWAAAVFLILMIFYLIDSYEFKKQPVEIIKSEIDSIEKIGISGYYNLLLLLIIIISVFITKPVFLREIIMIVTAIISYKITRKDIHLKNHFCFFPIREVAWLFFGIFITLTPVLYFATHFAGRLSFTSHSQFYWLTGILSAFLDNAPAYLTALTASMGIYSFDVNNNLNVAAFIGQHKDYLLSISIASVFFGAFTYIGNGPNFMVKSIAESYDVKTSSFFGYIFKFSLPILLPIFVLIWILFIR